MKYYATVYKAWNKKFVLSFLIPVVRFLFGMFIGNIYVKKYLFLNTSCKLLNARQVPINCTTSICLA